MNIQETTRQAFAGLFPESHQETVVAEETETETKEATPPEDLPRQNGIIEQDYKTKGYHLDVLCDPEQLLPAAEIMFELGYFIESITGVDWIKDGQLEVVYDFSRYDFDLCRTVIRVKIPRTDPHLPTLTDIYTGANWHERETHDFFGIVFDGHPHLIPLLLPEDADFHPLLKDFKA